MSSESLEFHVSLQRLLAALIIILLPLTIFGLFFALEADNHVRAMTGAQFRTITRSAAMTTADFIGERVQDVGVIANEPSVVAAVSSANQKYGKLDQNAVQAKSQELDKDWNTPKADQVVKAIVNSGVSDILRRHRDINGKLLRVTVVDEQGATVAATEKPMHYLQSDREEWRALYSQGKVAAYITDIRYDEQTRLNYISLSFPVLQPGTGRFIGAVNALVDISPIFNYLKSQQMARTGHVFLVREDGSVVTAEGISPTMKVRSDEYAAIHDALGTVRGREAGYILATLPDRKSYVIGFADTGLKDAFPNLGWTVLASQEEMEAVGPIRNVAHFAMFMMALSVLMVAVMSAYFFAHRKQRITDLEAPAEEKAKGAAA